MRRSQRTLEQRRQQTEHGRQVARFKFAQDRIRRIVDASPPLTPEQREHLAEILRTGQVADVT